MPRFSKNKPGCKCCADCNCVGTVTTDCPGTVGNPDTDASYYTFSISGLTNDVSCSSCATWDGDFKLCWRGNDTWETEASSVTSCGHTDGDPLWRLQRGGTNYTLTMLGPGHYWELANGSWSCLQNNVLAEGSPQPTSCGNRPATITLVPCMRCIYCSPDTDTPDTVQVDISGVTNRACQCADINGTFVLSGRPAACVWTLYDDQERGTCNHPQNCIGTPVLYRLRRGLTNGWTLDVMFTGGVLNCPSVRYSRTDADCTAAGSMAFVYSLDNYFCQGWESATVTLTPL